jgi:hypothetical protein
MENPPERSFHGVRRGKSLRRELTAEKIAIKTNDSTYGMV